MDPFGCGFCEKTFRTVESMVEHVSSCKKRNGGNGTVEGGGGRIVDGGDIGGKRDELQADAENKGENNLLFPRKSRDFDWMSMGWERIFVGNGLNTPFQNVSCD